ncbi:Metallo-dependent phosphatase-like protein [Haematococcus lacustris]
MLLLRKLIHMLFAALRQPALIAASLRRRHVARATPLTPYGNPLPEVVHQVVNTLKPGRLVIVGDVHGCHSELMSLLRKLEFDEALDNLAFVGDLVNKGPASRQVLASFRTMQALGVRGNHDDNCLQRWRVWHEQGSPLKPGSEWLSELDPEDVAVLEKLPFTLYLPTYGVLLCHAGLVPSMLHHTTVPEPEAAPSQPQRQLVSDLLSRQALANLVTMRNVVPRPKEDPRPSDDGKVREATTSAAGEWIGSPSASEGVAWAPTWPGPLHVFFGHDAKRRLQLEKFCTGLDTGCVYGGQLTAAVIPPLTQMTMQSEVARWWAAAATSAATGPPPSVTREALLCELVNVPADKMWCAPVTKTYKEAA